MYQAYSRPEIINMYSVMKKSDTQMIKGLMQVLYCPAVMLWSLIKYRGKSC